MEVKVVIDGKETQLEANGESTQYLKFKEPSQRPGRKKLQDDVKPIIATVYVLKEQKGGLQQAMDRVQK